MHQAVAAMHEANRERLPITSPSRDTVRASGLLRYARALERRSMPQFLANTERQSRALDDDALDQTPAGHHVYVADLCLTPELFPIRRYANSTTFDKSSPTRWRDLESDPEAMTHRARIDSGYSGVSPQRRRSTPLASSS